MLCYQRNIMHTCIRNNLLLQIINVSLSSIKIVYFKRIYEMEKIHDIQCSENNLCWTKSALGVSLWSDPFHDRKSTSNMVIGAIHKQCIRRHLDVDWIRLAMGWGPVVRTSLSLNLVPMFHSIYDNVRWCLVKSF